MNMTKLIFIDPGTKVNGQYYRDALLSQMLLAIKHVADDTFVFQQDNASSHHAKNTIKLLQWIIMSAAQSVWMSYEQCQWAQALPHWSVTACSRTLLMWPSTNGESDWEHAWMQMFNILNIYCERVWLTKVMDKQNVSNFVYSQKRCSFTAELVTFRVLKFPKVRYAITHIKQVRWCIKPPFDRILPSVHWHCWLGGRKGFRPVKIFKMGDGGGGHLLVRMEWRPAGWLVCLPLLIFPCTIKSRSSFLALADPGGPKEGL